MMRLRTLVLPLAGLLLVGAAVPSLRTALAEDYTTVPPVTSEMVSRIAGNELSFAAAVAIAEESAEGAKVASIEVADFGKPRYKVSLVSPTERRSLEISAKDGAILSKVVQPPFALPGAPVTGERFETASGLQYYEIVEGTGAKPPGAHSVVSVHYTGWLINGTKFDSSVDRGKPYTTALNRVIPGWTEGVGSMKVGGKRKLIVPFNLAYGPDGQGPIPPRATLVFDVELLEIVK